MAIYSKEFLLLSTGDEWRVRTTPSWCSPHKAFCKSALNADLKNSYYEGYTQNSKVTNLSVRNFFGAIIHAGINFPGS